ncbi:MAG: nicotinate-nucleotide adenylyltransferase [Bacteroidetes bacterium]|nr:nicotinate-nucleotide adenylyltransferase [Bacteroidota bacterium]MCL5025968.1 nicotinate-nucleotide adenylyltransferase [Chloroflexota bacterium]
MDRVGVLGGTFDPIHYGHLVIAEEAYARLDLREVLIVPARIPPHKQDRHITAAEHRVAMVRLAIASNPHFRLSTADLQRDGPSHTADTLALLRAQTNAELYFIIGEDSLLDLPRWYQPGRILAQCRLVVMSRPGYPEPDLRALASVSPEAVERGIVLRAPQLEISSSELQQRVAAGLPIKYQLPELVEDYIHAHRLYKRRAHRPAEARQGAGPAGAGSL